jgi:hypothetical protein
MAAVMALVQDKSQPNKVDKIMDGAAIVTPVDKALGIKNNKLVKIRVFESNLFSKNW